MGFAALLMWLQAPWIGDLVVHPKWRGRGIGTQLLVNYYYSFTKQLLYFHTITLLNSPLLSVLSI